MGIPEQPTNDDGLPIQHVCAICGNEFEDGDKVVEFREQTYRETDDVWGIVPDMSKHPVAIHIKHLGL